MAEPRVAHIVASLETGGAENMAVNLCNALAREREIHLIVTRREGPLKEKLDPRVKYLFLNRRKTLDIKAIKRLKNYLISFKIDILHLHSTSIFIGIWIKKLLPHIRLVWHYHHGGFLYKNCLQNFLTAFYLRNIDRFIVVNEETARFFREKFHFDKPIDVISNFAVLDRLGDTKLKGEKGQRILMIAGFRPEKNHLLALGAFRRLADKHPQAGLHFIGKAYKQDYYNQVLESIKSHKLEERVFIYGERTDIGHILMQADIGLLSSDFEGFPLTLIEYGLAGLPVVTTAVGGIPDWVRHGENGLLSPPGDAEKLAAHMDLLLSDPAERRHLGDAWKRTVAEHFSVEAATEKLLDIYSALK